MFEIKERTKIKVSIYGKDYEMTKPTFGQAQNLQSRLKSEGEGKSLEIMKEFISGLGLSSEVVESMELEHFISLVEFLSGQKKS